ncbi:hypothetical protein AMTR_s00167p00065270 [Amborella trichopoda]|uniref:Uncharacterized protein n=1 Tax=Amborella trichopoda TaxID=13333 RepID=W1PS74_AMBTC|nr:hypothetical protein AMTR_s00167p00065270 [Amborella trichopoda]
MARSSEVVTDDVGAVEATGCGREEGAREWGRLRETPMEVEKKMGELGLAERGAAKVEEAAGGDEVEVVA